MVNREFYSQKWEEARRRRAALDIYPSHFAKLIEKGLDLEKYQKESLQVYTSFAISEGNPLKLGIAMDFLGLLGKAEKILDPKVINEVADFQSIVHPNLDKHHNKNGYDNASGIVAVMHTGILIYSSLLESLVNEDKRFISSFNSAVFANYHFTKARETLYKGGHQQK